MGHPAVAHPHDALDQWGQRAELVGDQHDGGSGADQRLQRRGEGVLARGVDPGGRLVEHEQLGLPRERRAMRTRCC
jgi:hypothetical protein